VAVRRLVLAAEVDPGTEDVQAIADRMVNATARWWACVSSWIEIVTGQHLTHVGHHVPQVIGNRIPIWLNEAGGQHSSPMKVPAKMRIELSPLHVVDDHVFQSAALLAEPGPPLSWVLLRDARSLNDAGQYRRAVIDAATASDVAVTQLLDAELQVKNPTNRTQILNKSLMLGQKLSQLETLGSPLPQSFRDKLVAKRNVAVHEGAVIGEQECSDAIDEAVLVVEKAFPLPIPPGGGTALVRMW
jgi:hypothetical protein